jgi:hypothetical protein
VLTASEPQIAAFVKTLFIYADPESFVSLRAFDQKERGGPARFIEGVQIGTDMARVVKQAAFAAERAANEEVPAVFAPPVATFNNPRTARSDDVANGVAISVEVDSGDPAKARAKLEQLIGPVTVALTSGGEWCDPDTGEVHDKVHLHWRLSEPTATPDDHRRLQYAREIAARLVGGDPTAAPPAHPLRWPGSWNRKAKPRLAKIFAGNPQAEVHLEWAIERLEEAVEAAGLGRTANDGPRASGTPTADMQHVASALAHMTNVDLGWEAWNRIGMAAWRASGGNQAGLDAWCEWSAKSAKHEDQACVDRWAHYAGSPPTRIGAGTIFFEAAAQGWVRPKRDDEPPEYDEGYYASLHERYREEHERANPNAPEEVQPKPIDDAALDTPFPVIFFRDVQASIDAADFVEGMLISSAMSVVYGPSNSGKTFFVSDMALHVASGIPWNGREVDHGGVLWLAMEGAHGIANRIAAWKADTGYEEGAIHFAYIPVALDLLRPDTDTRPLIQTIRIVAARMGVPIKLVVIDTLSRAIAGGNENSPEDMGALVTNGTLIQQSTKAHVLWIHHSGKDEAKGARGHSLLRAATDTEIEISASEDGQRNARVTKQREMECSGEFPFTLKAIELGINRRGKPVTSCVVVHSQESAGAALSVTRLRGHAKRALEVLTAVVVDQGKGGYVGVPEGIMSVPDSWWRERFYDQAMPGSEQGAKQRAFLRVSSELVQRHIVGMAGGRVWITSHFRKPHTDTQT